MELTERDLLLRLADTEDHFVERKSSGDSKDWLKSVVAFANSTPIGQEAVLFIGVKHDGTVEGKDHLDTLQRTFRKKMEAAYPPIPTFSKVLKCDGKEFLAVIVPGSKDGPHFAGPSYVRDGSETIVASREQFARLIAKRSDPARKILEWQGKEITVIFLRKGGTVSSPKPRRVEDCDQFYVTLKGTITESIPLNRVTVSHDNGENRLKLEIQDMII